MLKEMLSKALEGNIVIYTMMGLCGFGILMRLITGFLYSKLIRESSNMNLSEHKLMKQLKLKCETSYKLKIGVSNVDAFVDKYVYRYKFGGLHLYTWENICGQTLMLCLLIGAISTLMGAAYGCGKEVILSTFFIGLLLSVLLITLDGFANISSKRQILKNSIREYLDNYLKIRLQQEYFNPELLEEYRKEYFEESLKDDKEQIKRKNVIKEVKNVVAEEKKNEDMNVIEDVLAEYLS